MHENWGAPKKEACACPWVVPCIFANQPTATRTLTHPPRVMPDSNSTQTPPGVRLNSIPLLTALRNRRSRRFGLGMKIPGGPLTYESRHAPRPLSEDEEAALVFAACGLTGHALADLCYAK